MSVLSHLFLAHKVWGGTHASHPAALGGWLHGKLVLEGSLREREAQADGVGELLSDDR